MGCHGMAANPLQLHYTSVWKMSDKYLGPSDWALGGLRIWLQYEKCCILAQGVAATTTQQFYGGTRYWQQIQTTSAFSSRRLTPINQQQPNLHQTKVSVTAQRMWLKRRAHRCTIFSCNYSQLEFIVLTGSRYLGDLHSQSFYMPHKNLKGALCSSSLLKKLTSQKQILQHQPDFSPVC